MKNRSLIVSLTFVAMFAANQAGAFYNPSTGHWLSRDPNGEPGFETARAANAAPRIGGTASFSAGRLINRDPINGSKVLTRSQEQLKRNEEKNLYSFARNSPVNFYDPLGNHPVGWVFPESWRVSGDDVGKAGGWYAVHCALHCWEQSINRLLNCPLNGNALLYYHTVVWERMEEVGAALFGIETLREPYYDSLTDVVANTYGATLSKQCAGGCKPCGFDFFAKAMKARECCDKGCAAAQDEFLQYAWWMHFQTGEQWEP